MQSVGVQLIRGAGVVDRRETQRAVPLVSTIGDRCRNRHRLKRRPPANGVRPASQTTDRSGLFFIYLFQKQATKLVNNGYRELLVTLYWDHGDSRR